MMTAPQSMFDTREFRQHLRALKAGLTAPSGGWYPYDSLQVFSRCGELVDAGGLSAAQLFSGPVLDIGCADGDIAFFLESKGCSVDAVDHAPTNYNQMHGVRALHQHLRSTVRLFDIDVDSQFILPRREYHLVLFLGILYHLKNPWYALEKLARASRYVLLSTTVGRLSRWTSRIRQEAPLVYLADDDEFNNDSTNYWVFSETALQRLLRRTGWEVRAISRCESRERGARKASILVDRVFCLIESEVTRRFTQDVECLRGWHNIEEPGWRWTEQRFSVAVQSRGKARRLHLDLELPDSHFQALGPIGLCSSVAGVEVGRSLLSAPGSHTHVCNLAACAHLEQVHVEFCLDKALPAGSVEARELGIIATGIRLESRPDQSAA